VEYFLLTFHFSVCGHFQTFVYDSGQDALFKISPEDIKLDAQGLILNQQLTSAELFDYDFNSGNNTF
jgi:hypothetical protein